MISPEIRARIKHLEILTRRMVSGNLLGDYSVAQKGYGLEFEQLADYTPGDDIRYVDWKSSARMNKMLIKEYREERNRTILLAVDCSASTFFGSSAGIKYDLNAEIASVLALIASYGKDQVGLILFSDTIELFIPPLHTRAHVHSIIKTLFSLKPRITKTSLSALFEYLGRLRRKNSAVFVISDFIDYDFERAMACATKRTEIVAVRCTDRFEYVLPSIGLVMAQDSETGEQMLLDARSNKVTSSLLSRIYESQNALFVKYGVDCLEINTGQPYISTMVRFFRQRLRY
jgi:uncharacterized protein (DUF58 family)